MFPVSVEDFSRRPLSSRSSTGRLAVLRASLVLASIVAGTLWVARASAVAGWTTVASMPTARSQLGAATAPNGLIYAVGGRDKKVAALDVVEAYDAASDIWSTVASMPTARTNMAVVTGPDGRIYAIGGFDAGFQPLSSVDAYDPASDTWTAVAPMPTARGALAAALGGDGRIYAIGGTGAGFIGGVRHR